ncbi:hypothetical protein [Phytoactinopolyspora halotolerans]|uniref:DNA-binding protein n=1 Tax=Phytoactinopolyspora halotolerans TaxID=1981512 RepID=A0A6L9S806_9ACTN|nr:hypothetical protein [Phytoactinopolyspora halotolerans]NEE01133.1 hypothetical protein [Phytoactinopolyspora halotolerans]
MRVYVLTVDQRRSRTSRDLVEDALLSVHDHVSEPVLHFERTAGDEFQGVLSDAADVIRVSLALMRQGTWSVGIGIGDADEPIPDSTRAARGSAFVYAREALETAKRRTPTIAAISQDDRARDADALLTLLAALIAKRTAAGWEAIDLLDAGHTIADAADRLGITRQAVGQRLAVALWQQERDVHPLAARLLEEAAG